MRDNFNYIILYVSGLVMNWVSQLTRDDINFLLSVIISVLFIVKTVIQIRNDTKKNS